MRCILSRPVVGRWLEEQERVLVSSVILRFPALADYEGSPVRHLITVALLAFAATAAAAPDYRTIKMEIDINRPASEVWAKVGGYCDISKWLEIDCQIVTGDGGIGTVRSLANGRVLEILV